MFDWIKSRIGIKLSNEIDEKTDEVMICEYQSITNQDNPFSRIFYVKVKDVRNGWVNYAHLPIGDIFNDESMRVKEFLEVYEISNRDKC